jgi:hypothetical protein
VKNDSNAPRSPSLRLGEIATAKRLAGAEERRGRAHRRRSGRRPRRRCGLGEREHAFDDGSIVRRRRRGMVRLEPTEEAAIRARSRSELEGFVLDHRHRVLVLATHAGKARLRERSGSVARPRREAVELERIGREARPSPERTDRGPRVASVDGEVLSRRHDPAASRMRERRVIEVLAHVVLVHADRAVGRDREVLRVEEVERRSRRARVLQRDVPEPRGLRLREHE